MVSFAFIDPTEQSAYDTSKAEIRQKKTDISIQLRSVNKDHDELIKPETTKHEKRRLLTTIDYKLETMREVLNQLGNVKSKCMARVMTTDLDDVTQKAVLEQEEKELQAELQIYEEKLTEFNRSKSETIDRIHAEVKGPTGGGEFVTPHALGPSRDPIIKYVPQDELIPTFWQKTA